MNRVKYTSTTTGTGAITLSVASGFQSLANSQGNGYANSGTCLYTILDANGTAWERGYGSISGSTLTRTAIIESTNADAAISLTAGTHTILLNRAHEEGFILMSAYEPSSAYTFSTATQTITFASVYGHQVNSQPMDGVSYAPGHQNGTVANIVGDPEGELPYCRGFRLTLRGACDTSSAGDYWGVGIDPDDFSTDPMWAAWAPLAGTGTTVSVTTPIIEARSPWGGANSAYFPYAAIAYRIMNTSGANITASVVLFIEWYL